MDKLLLETPLSVLTLVVPDFPFLFVWHLHVYLIFLCTSFCMGKADACEPVGMWTNRNIPVQVSVSITGFPWLLLLHNFNFFKTVSQKHFFSFATMCLFAPCGVNFRRPEPVFQKYKRIKTSIPLFYTKFVISNYKIPSVLRRECFTQYIEHTCIS